MTLPYRPCGTAHLDIEHCATGRVRGNQVKNIGLLLGDTSAPPHAVNNVNTRVSAAFATRM